MSRRSSERFPPRRARTCNHMYYGSLPKRPMMLCTAATTASLLLLMRAAVSLHQPPGRSAAASVAAGRSRDVTSGGGGGLNNGEVKRADNDVQTRCRPCTCGVGYSGSRIVGGTEAGENEYPWMASLWNARRKFFCGGSIVTDQYVLTAAHCFSVFNEDPSLIYRDIYVAVGQDKRPNRLQYPGTPSVIRASMVKLHHRYNPKGENVHDNDIALVKLSKPVTFERHTQSICLPSIRNDYGDMTGTVAGWGQLSEISTTSLSLRHATLPIWSEKECSKVPEFKKTGFTANMLCAGLKEGGKDSCQGDSGGPLMIFDDNDKITVAGIVSWGIGCGAPRLPGVYTRVDKYLGWIMRHTRDSCHCTS